VKRLIVRLVVLLVVVLAGLGAGGVMAREWVTLPNLGEQAMQAMTLQVNQRGAGWVTTVAPTELGQTEAGNAVVRFRFNSYTPPVAVRLLWNGEKVAVVEWPKLPGVLYKNQVDVELRSNGSYNITVAWERVKAYLGGGRYGYKSGNEIAPETLGLQCPNNRYVKPWNGPLGCAEPASVD